MATPETFQTPISPQLVKMLKESGFYNDWKGMRLMHQTQKKQQTFCFYTLPNIADVRRWIYINHRIWIDDWTKFDENETYGYFITITKKGINYIRSPRNFKSPAESYLAAFEHTLNNLI